LFHQIGVSEGSPTFLAGVFFVTHPTNSFADRFVFGVVAVLFRGKVFHGVLLLRGIIKFSRIGEPRLGYGQGKMGDHGGNLAKELKKNFDRADGTVLAVDTINSPIQCVGVVGVERGLFSLFRHQGFLGISR
jgi:hypothetical protein